MGGMGHKSEKSLIFQEKEESTCLTGDFYL